MINSLEKLQKAIAKRYGNDSFLEGDKLSIQVDAHGIATHIVYMYQTFIGERREKIPIQLDRVKVHYVLKGNFETMKINKNIVDSLPYHSA